MTAIADAKILVTGGASGIGRLLALELARRGGELTLWDVDADGLDRAVRDVAEAGGRPAHGHLCDIADRERVYAVAARTVEEAGRVDVLVNNAGIVSGKPLLELADAKIEATFRINTMALFWTAKAFLPAMLARDRGHVVTIASAAGYVGVSKLSDYSASKWGAVAFDESLRFELAKAGSRVTTTVVCPFYVHTGMFDGVKSRVPLLLPILRPEHVVRRIADAIARDKRRLIMPPLVGLLPMARVLPVRLFDGLMNALGVNTTMDEFVGRDSDRAAPPRGR